MLTSAPRSGCLATPSVAEATRSRSPGVSSVAFRAQSPNLRFAPLMDMDFAVRCPLVRHWRLISGFCSSTRTFDRCFLQTPPRDGSPCIISRPSPPSGWPEDFHLQTTEHARHTTEAQVAPCGSSQETFITSALLLDHIEADCCALYRLACERNLEGIVGKHRGGLYDTRRPVWIKDQKSRVHTGGRTRRLFEDVQT